MLQLSAPVCSQAEGWLPRGLLVRPTTAVLSTVGRDTGRMFTLGMSTVHLDTDRMFTLGVSTVHLDADRTFTPLTTAAQVMVARIMLSLETTGRRGPLAAPQFVAARAAGPVVREAAGTASRLAQRWDTTTVRP